MQENHQLIIKELQHNSAQILEPVHKLSFNLYKTYDQKLEDLKSSLERSIQSINYNLSHCHRDVKEIKDDSTYMKNRVIWFSFPFFCPSLIPENNELN